MTLEQRLDDLLAWARGATEGWAADLSEADRAAAGRPDRWAARDLLIHFAEWAEVSRDQFAAVAEGRKPVELPPDDEVNQVFFERNRDLSWAEARGKFEDAFDALRAQVASMTPESLAGTDSPAGGRPVWWDVAFGTVDHLIRHLSENYIEREQGDAADALIDAGSARMAALDESPRFRALIIYNLACHYAIRGHRDQALDKLREALALRPDMTDYAGQDPDFRSLRQDPAYQALVGG